MSKPMDMKRVNLTTMAATSANSAAAAAGAASLPPAAMRFNAEFAQDKPSGSSNNNNNVNKKRRQTIRLELELGVSDTNTYPEFNFEQLVRLERKKQKKLKTAKSNGTTSDDPFVDDTNDNAVTRIAKEMERKYGAAYACGRKKKRDDECDIGMGYDDNDSFIDNTDAYDEIVPEFVETAEGGFYVNSGPLSFKNLIKTSTTTKTDEIIKMPERPKKKRILSSSSEDSDSSSSEKATNNADTEAEASEDIDDEEDDEEEEEEDEYEERMEVSEDDTAMPAKKLHKQAAKRHKTNSSSNATATHDVAKKKKNKKENHEQKKRMSKQLASSSNSPKPTTDEVNSDSDKEMTKQKEITVKDMLKAQRDTYIKRQESVEKSSATSANDEMQLISEHDKSSSGDSSSDDDSDSSSEDSDSTQSSTKEQSEQQQQQQQLQQHELLLTEVTNNANAAGNMRATQLKLPELDEHVRLQIAEFLEIALRKQSADGSKKFQFDNKLSKSFWSLDECLRRIDKHKRSMVFAYMEHQLELQKYYFLRKAKQLSIKEEKVKLQNAMTQLRRMVTSAMPAVIKNYDQQLHKFVELQALDLDADDEPPEPPRKTFLWNDETREALQNLYRVRLNSFAVLGTRKETPEQFMDTFLREKVVNMWPNNFMRFEDLKAELELKKKSSKIKDKQNDKKKESSNVAAAVDNNIAMPIQQQQQQQQKTLPAAAAKVGSITVVNTSLLLKQYDDNNIANRSTANSDNESVASGSKSLKNINKSNKSKKLKKDKMQKLEMQLKQQTLLNLQKQQQLQLTNNSNNSTAMPIDLISPSKRTDHSISNIIYSNYNTNTNSSSNNNNNSLLMTNDVANVFAANTSHNNKKHSTTAAAAAASTTTASNSNNNIKPVAAHIINLDNYKTADDIIQTSQQLLRKTAAIGNGNKSMAMQEDALAAAARKQDITICKVNAGINNFQHQSSSESDGVEYIGCTPAPTRLPTTSNSKKQKKNGGAVKKAATATATTTTLNANNPIVINDFDVMHNYLSANASTSMKYNNNNINNNLNNNNNNGNAKSKKIAYNNSTKPATADAGLDYPNLTPTQINELLAEINNLQHLQQQKQRLNSGVADNSPRASGSKHAQ